MTDSRPRYAHACNRGIFLGRTKPCGCVIVTAEIDTESIRSFCSPAHRNGFAATGELPIEIYGNDLFYCDRHFNFERVVSMDNNWCSVTAVGMGHPALTTALHLALARGLLDLSTESSEVCCFPGEHGGQFVEPFWNMASCERHAPLAQAALEALVEVGAVAEPEPTNDEAAADAADISDTSVPAPPQIAPQLSREEFDAMKERFRKYLAAHDREWPSKMDEIVRKKDLPLLFDLVEDHLVEMPAENNNER